MTTSPALEKAMDIKAKVVPWSSVVGTGLMLMDGDDGPCVAQFGLFNVSSTIPQDELKAFSVAVVTKIADAINHTPSLPSGGDVGEIRKRLDAVASQFGTQWGYESCGEKGDGSNMVGVLFHPDDENAEHPLLGRCDPIYDEKAAEYRDYYRDELIADVEHRNRCSGAIAEFISHAPSDMTTLLAALTASEAERERLAAENVKLGRVVAMNYSHAVLDSKQIRGDAE